MTAYAHGQPPQVQSRRPREPTRPPSAVTDRAVQQSTPKGCPLRGPADHGPQMISAYENLARAMFTCTPTLAAYAGLAPATRNSGSSIRGEQPSRRGNKQLKRAFFLSAFAALGDPASRTYYDKKIAQGKHHTQALLCLARRRADVLFAMLRDGTFYEPRTTATVI
ncbi:transposase [Streptomyces sp. NPDC005374]|uniref:transposase n=1 Tax=Streptomyces sp. NPDC005374 TaxID=3364713 RepID=UPI00369E362C